MDYLIHSEIHENSIIMIEFENGKNEPYFVDQKNIGAITGATMLLGYTLSYLIERPHLYPYPCTRNGSGDRFYIANENKKGHMEGVNGYRKLTQKEKNKWLKKLKSVTGLSELQKVLLSS